MHVIILFLFFDKQNVISLIRIKFSARYVQLKFMNTCNLLD